MVTDRMAACAIGAPHAAMLALDLAIFDGGAARRFLAVRGHLLRDDDRKKVADIREMHIDIGAKDGDDARVRVRVGDVAVIDARPVELPNRRLAARALDDRLGSYVALESARLEERLVRHGLSATILQDDIENTALDPDSDLLLATLLLEHIDWHRGVEVFAALRPATCGIIIQENPHGMTSAVTLMPSTFLATSKTSTSTEVVPGGAIL